MLSVRGRRRVEETLLWESSFSLWLPARLPLCPLCPFPAVLQELAKCWAEQRRGELRSMRGIPIAPVSHARADCRAAPQNHWLSLNGLTRGRGDSCVLFFLAVRFIRFSSLSWLHLPAVVFVLFRIWICFGCLLPALLDSTSF